MDQIITYDKSLQQRLQEYLDVLSGTDVLAVSQLKNVWAFYLELACDPSGWQAVWKISRTTCESLKIPFPTIVLVYIEDLDNKDLSVYARILAVQDDISLPEKHVVPIMQLYPTIDQDNSVALNMQSTANTIDMLRFFYNNLIMPWDYDDDDTSDWVSKHLESRLRLYYDMKNGVIPRSIAEHVKGLIMEARKLQIRREQIELDIEEEDFDGENLKDMRIQSLMELHVGILRIKCEVEILENPLMRNVVLKQEREKLQRSDSTTPIYWLITDSCNVDGYTTLLKEVKKFYAEEKLKFTTSLMDTLNITEKSDVLILNKGKHELKTVGKLEKGGMLKGIHEIEATEILSQSDDVMFDFSGNVILENITINVEKSQCAILVRYGEVTLKNCKLIGKHQGIIVLQGSKLNLINCDITGFCTAIVGNSGAKIDMNETNIHHVNFGIKMYDNCTLLANNSTFSNCSEYGFCVETDKVTHEKHQIGSFGILKLLPDISILNVKGKENSKGDVSINRIAQIQPVKDLFSDTFTENMDITGCEDGSELLNNTVIEIKQ